MLALHVVRVGEHRVQHGVERGIAVLGPSLQCRKAAEHVGRLLDLAPDDATRAKIGDAISAVKRGGTLPALEDVRRRLGLSQDPGAPVVTFGQAWDEWLAAKRKFRPSSRRRIEQIGRDWLLPAVADVALERFSIAHATAVFERIAETNAQITRQRAEGRALIKAEGDVRQRSVLGGAGQRSRLRPR